MPAEVAIPVTDRVALERILLKRVDEASVSRDVISAGDDVLQSSPVRVLVAGIVGTVTA